MNGGFQLSNTNFDYRSGKIWLFVASNVTFMHFEETPQRRFINVARLTYLMTCVLGHFANFIGKVISNEWWISVVNN